MGNRKNNSLHIDPELKLSALPVFRWTFAGFVLATLICTVVISWHSDLSFDFSYKGFNFGLFTVFRVPLAILASMLPILGLIAAIHRSSQTSLQIQKTSEQNIFANYYKHREEYINHLNELKENLPHHIQSEFSEIVVRKFYKISYPFNSPTNFSIESKMSWVEHIDEDLIKLFYILSEMPNAKSEGTLSYLLREFHRVECSIRQDLFNINTPEQAESNIPVDKKILLKYWDQTTTKITMESESLLRLIQRISDYADLIVKLKSAADEFEGTMLYGISEYTTTSENQITLYKKHTEGIAGRLYASHNNEINISEQDYKDYIVLEKRMHERFDRKIKELESIREKKP